MPPKRTDALKGFTPIKPSEHPKVSVGIPKNRRCPTPAMKKPVAVMKMPKLPGC